MELMRRSIIHRELKLMSSRSGRINQKAVTTNILEAISQFSGGEMAADGRVRILVKKEDLKQVLEAIRDVRAAPPFEHRLNMMLRRKILRAARPWRWRPALQSIPEEEL